MIRDYQRSACYAWEDRHIHPNDTGTVPFDQAQAIVDYVWRTAGLAHPPKMRPLALTARTLHATATRLWIRIPTFSIDGLMVAARQERVEFNFEGPIHLADPSR